MLEEEVPQKLEFGDCEIAVVDGSHALVAKETDSNICLKDHGDVIGAIAYRQGDDVGVVLSNEANDVCLLTRAYAAANYCFSRSRDF